MTHNLSPGVERAVAAVPASPSIADWLAVLLQDDEARPAMLLEKVHADRTAILAKIKTLARAAAPAWDDLARRARDTSVALRGDPDFTTDHILIALLKGDHPTTIHLQVSVTALEAALRSPLVEAGEPVAVAPPTPILPDVTDRHDATRIVDVNLNRAREALRILDDYARFIRNDATLTATIKTLRHRLADVIQTIPVTGRLAARDTAADVGKHISTAAEYDRGTPGDVAIVNGKRLQEALRSAEEYGKLLSPHAARELEAIRYEAYTLEKAMLGGSPLRERLAAARLYFLVGAADCPANLSWTIEEAIAGGVDVVQLREKTISDRELLGRAGALRDLTRRHRVLFIVNDRPDIARLCDADGVHLGQDDLSVQEARRLLGPGPLVGISTHDLNQIQDAVRDGADYLGIGPTFPSTTKPFDSLAGLDFIRQATAATTQPMFALGGINHSTIEEAIAAGATRVAVSAVIAKADDPRLAAQRLRMALGSNPSA
jgi:thiamine-phosphate pyrophosphorylase